jgi:hypothetical protein
MACVVLTDPIVFLFCKLNRVYLEQYVRNTFPQEMPIFWGRYDQHDSRFPKPLADVTLQLPILTVAPGIKIGHVIQLSLIIFPLPHVS